MSESIASWVTLSALIASIAWYISQTPDKNINHIMMAAVSGVLCLFGGFLISGAIMKVTGSFENALVPALLVCIGTAICVVAHSIYKRKQETRTKPE
ncbi:hypothetical protein [Neptuniibacter caesariensis]|uniref:Uncharacterized protein n=1 Tax=Neptuniibacter caesariensis TaxID=207954 RepID=A0A7U8C9B0_NEPCE|nr:hypothetical protein [Neptuniibacter caesariensis]EAR62480.1 hypothetical protein MED92_15623 [Oceanospirillum sp. MED92] [Neptuniibacter caesariensis]